MEAHARQLERELEESQAENTILRGIVAKVEPKCVHCGLTDKSQCSRGFPGCAWADDLLCGEEEESRYLISKLTAHKAAIKKLTAVLKEIPKCRVSAIPSEVWIDGGSWSLWMHSRNEALTAINSLQQCPTTPTANG